MLLLVAVGPGLPAPPSTGRRRAAEAVLPWRCGWALVAALGLQLGLSSVLSGPPSTLRAAAHLGSYLLAAWALAANRRLPGMWLIAVGAGLNVVAIAANGGVMPASEWAVATAGIEAQAGQFHNSGVLASPRLLLLGDVLALPAAWPLSNVFSAGDVLLAAGGAVVARCGAAAIRSAQPGPAQPST
ncbi:MAG TPA: DUF5317 family protein [Egibacteraceae bacterium]|nr:DUF5317 family protein [Egibacteraceae bacterium]